MINEGLNIMTENSHEIASCPISKEVDTIISVGLLPIAIFTLGFAYYLFYIKLTALPFILLASLFFGFSCLGLTGMWKLRNNV